MNVYCTVGQLIILVYIGDFHRLKICVTKNHTEISVFASDGHVPVLVIFVLKCSLLEDIDLLLHF